MSLLEQVLVFLVAAVVAVVAARRAGLASVLGYLLVGTLLGPWMLDLVEGEHDILHFSEFGIVLVLFVIGLELQPRRLWAMRKPLLGLGGAQVALTSAVLAAAAHLLGLSLQAAIVTGFALSLSSTAFALQLLAERKELVTRHGRLSLSVLLFQDIAVIPMLAVLSLLAVSEAGSGGQPVWIDIVQAVAMIALVTVGGHYGLRYALRAVARFGNREAFTAMALTTVVGAGVLMDAVGVSMALGAFLAGVLLAESEYRHELEADIEPFKGLLLGLFFMAIGMTLDVGLLLEAPLTILAIAVGLLVVKAVCLAAVCLAAGQSPAAAARVAATLCQGGEFAFVILNVGVASALMPERAAELLTVAVIFSMAATPPLLVAAERLASRAAGDAEPEPERERAQGNQVIVAGFGRVGQMVGRILQARRIGFTALEVSAEQVDFVRRFGNKIHYGDASRPDLLRAAGAEGAVLFVLAIDDVERSLATARTVVRHFPHLVVHARARNRQHAYRLMDLGIAHIVRDTFYSSLEMSYGILVGLGMSESESLHTVDSFRAVDERRLLAQHAIADDPGRMAREAEHWSRELEDLFAQDERDSL